MLLAVDKETLCLSMRTLQEWCEQWAVKVNVKKLGVLLKEWKDCVQVLHKGKMKTVKEFLSERVKIIAFEEYQYLGCMRVSTGSVRKWLRNCKSGFSQIHCSKWLRSCRAIGGEVKAKTLSIVILNILRRKINNNYENMQIIYKLVKQYCECRETHAVSVTKMALADHQVESMVTQDGWWSPGLTAQKAQDCRSQEGEAQGCAKPSHSGAVRLVSFLCKRSC